MGRFFVALNMIFILLLAASISAAQQEGLLFQRYKLEKGVIHYEITGERNGKEIVFFDQWGMREARYSRITKKIFGLTDLLVIWQQEATYTIDLIKKIGNKKENVDFKRFLKQALSDKGMLDFSQFIIKDMGGKMKGREKINGKPCEVWFVKNKGLTFWLWNGIPIRIVEKEGSKKTITVATSIEEPAQMPEKAFDIPKDIFFIEEDVNTIVLSLLRARSL